MDLARIELADAWAEHERLIGVRNSRKQLRPVRLLLDHLVARAPS